MPKKSLTTEEFIVRARETHGTTYDYSSVVVKTSKIKIEITCPAHGVFLQQPGVHMRGQGCPSCYKDKLVTARLKKEEQNKIRKPRGNPFKNKTPTEMAIMQDKKRQTNMERYGVENPSQADFVKRKKEETSQVNYGVSNPMKSYAVQTIQQNTNLERYGVKNAAQNKAIREKMYNTQMKKYGIHPAKLQISKNKTRTSHLLLGYQKLQNHLPNGVVINFEFKDYSGFREDGDWIPYDFRCNVCDTQFTRKLVEPKKLQCPTCRVPSYVSKAEQEISNFLTNLGVTHEQGNRSLINPFELDIVIHDKKIAIEYCGLYWHSETNGKGRRYHLEKLDRCTDKGYKLITIFEDEWNNKQHIVKSRLQYMLGKGDKGVGARKLTIKEIQWSMSKDFLNTHHIQGSGPAGNIRYGAFYENILVGVMTFCNPRIALGRSDGYPELLRFATDGRNHSGLASKLFKRYCIEHNPKGVISYADRRWSVGNLYEQMGFVKTGTSEPSYYYMKDYKIRVHRYKFRKHTIVANMGGDANKTEWENMQDFGYDRIWNCGTLRYEFIV